MKQLIAKQRLLRLTEGSRFHKISPKGQTLRDKYWFCRLSPNQREFQYGDLDDHSKDELPNKISLNDIKSLLLGKECPLTKKTSVDLAFSIVYDNEVYLNFVATDYKTFCYWIDGINHLLKMDMNSEEYHKDLAMLLDVEMKVKSMDV